MAAGKLCIGFVNSSRQFSTSSVKCGKKNFRKFPLFNFRGTRQYREKLEKTKDPEVYHTYGVRETGYTKDGKFYEVPEMIPELIVPNLTGCKLMPYVSYKAPEVSQHEFTAEDLFYAIYSKKIELDFNKGKLAEDGSPLKPDENESLTAKEAKKRARKTGSDFYGDEVDCRFC